jgi:hypothetical protein
MKEKSWEIYEGTESNDLFSNLIGNSVKGDIFGGMGESGDTLDCLVEVFHINLPPWSAAMKFKYMAGKLK